MSKGPKEAMSKDLETPVKPTSPSARAAAAQSMVTPKRRLSERVKRKKRKSVEDNTYYDLALEANLHDCAQKNHLSPPEMKMLLRKLVTNEHVVALVRLQEEDEIKKDNIQSEIKIKKDNIQSISTVEAIKKQKNQSTSTEEDSPQKDENFRKLTRSKTKEMTKAPILMLPSLRAPEPEPEMVALVADELHSDVEDEEYEPKEEDYMTDDDPNATCSDMDSQPRTPYSPYVSSPVKSVGNGMFRISRVRTDSTSSVQEEDIAKRTRSKISLETTSIEAIEGSFKPPDIYYDACEMYDSDEGDMHKEWIGFLNDFSKPLSTTIVNDEDDPVADPEYVAAEKVTMDAEELRDVNISKKELNDLVNQLFEGLGREGVFFDDIPRLGTPKKILEHLNRDNATIATPKKPMLPNESVQQEGNYQILEAPNCSQISQFVPNLMSTPQCYYTNEQPIQSSYQNSKYQNNNQYTTVSSDPYATSCLFPTNPIPNSNPFSAMSHNITNPTNESLTMEQSETIVKKTKSKYKKRVKGPSIPFDVCRGSRFVSVKTEIKREYTEEYESLKNIDVEEEVFEDAQVGYTSMQLEILQQQLRIHVQLLSQNYIQMYSHPEYWKYADRQKYMLQEIEKEVMKGPLTVWNLSPAIALLHEWEDELSVDSEENRNLMEFMHNEIKRVKTRTNTFAKNIMRFPPRILKKILSSSVFLYPQYLPRIPFRTDVGLEYHEFAPSEATLAAFGLERYLNDIEKNELCLSYMKKRSPLSVACERMCGDVIFNKSPRRIYDFIKQHLRNQKYNPIKFFFDKRKAPPFKHTITEIDFNDVAAPERRYSELPAMWKEFATVLQAVDIQKTCPSTSFNQYVHEELTPQSDYQVTPTSRLQKSARRKTLAKSFATDSPQSETPSVVVNINYIFDGSTGNLINSSDYNFGRNLVPSESDETLKPRQLIKTDRYESVCDNVSYKPTWLRGQRTLTDYFSVKNPELDVAEDTSSATSPRKRSKPASKIYSTLKTRTFVSQKFAQAGKRYRKTKRSNKKVKNLFANYKLTLIESFNQYQENTNLFRVFKYFKILELYTNLLGRLKMNCKKLRADEIATASGKKMKAPPADDEVTKSKKAHRQEENLRHMMLPESRDEINKKDAIFAYNYYEKVEEIMKNSNKQEDFKTFEKILRTFDAKRQKVADLYYKLETLFLPDHPELAETFLTFLLPSEAKEIGKFFEHFMLTNMTTFIVKLNTYFNKQPAQIRKIFNSLHELSEDPEVSMEKIKAKILPLMKGNQFLIDWFMQIFPTEPPSDRLLGVSETVNLKEIDSNTIDGKVYENITASDLLEDCGDSSQCQLKYVNGRLFYGSKIQLPAKLAFMADDLTKNKLTETVEREVKDETVDVMTTNHFCVHGIREYGEKKLRTALPDNSWDDIDKSDDEDAKDIPDTQSTFNICDEASLRSHAIRLNPSLYQSDAETNPHIWTNSSRYKSSEDGKQSPKKQFISKERRKSPKKTIPKSPVCAKRCANQISSDSSTSSTSNAINTAKKLKALIEDHQPPSEADESKIPLVMEVEREDDSEELISLFVEEEEEELPSEEEEFGALSSVNTTATDTSAVADDDHNGNEIAWTRDEDKIILQEIKMGFDCEETLINRIKERMLNRTNDEILSRHRFLMEVLSKLQGAAE